LLKKFEVQCLKLLGQIPKGKVTTYREIAKALDSQAYRAVGRAMARNRDLVVVPCHRVVCSNGKVGGYANGIDQKIKLLEREGIPISREKVVDLEVRALQVLSIQSFNSVLLIV
jgi:methylated-DNA-[protein]-cysteine S-methyltransferase